MRGLVAALLLVAGVTPAVAQQVELTLDVRAVSSHGEASWLNGGLGKLRFDDTHDGLRLGQLYLGLRQDIFETLQLHVDAVAYGDHDSNPVDLTEAYLEWRPWPSSPWRSKARLGAYYPSISFENVLPGWRSPYSLSWSAINSWLGEEIRSIGAEYSIDFLGARAGKAFDFGATVGLFGWNDPAGVVIAARGWALHDRQTTLFGRVGQPGNAPVNGRTLVEEIDHRPGYYVSTSAGWRDRLQARVLHYDNRGDRRSYSQRIDDVAWETYFDSLGLQWTPTSRLTLIAQHLRGETWIDPFIPFSWKFDSTFLLSSYQMGANRLTLRRDWFSLQQTAGRGRRVDEGSAWTVAALHDFDRHWSVAAEALWVDSTADARAALGLPVGAAERSLQFALRYTL